MDEENNRTQQSFPVINSDMVIEPKLAKVHLKELEPEFSNSVCLYSTSNRSASYGGVPAPEKLLLNECSKEHVRTTENFHSAPKLLIFLYCPLWGVVFYSHAATFTTEIAAMQCGQGCVSTKEDRVCFRLA